jgi:hypothetical protein
LKGILVAVFFAVALLDSPGAPGRKCVIAVAPVGDVSAERIEALPPTLRETFGCEIEIAPAVPLPPFGWNAERRQQLSTAILDALAHVKRPEWERLLGVAGVDLYVPQLNFVFGEGDSRRGVAVFSLVRLHGRDPGERAAVPAPFAAQLIQDGYDIRTNLQRLPSLVEKPINTC